MGIIYRGGSQGSISQNDISGWDWGIGAIWGSSPITSLESGSRNNRVTNNRIGVDAYQSSWPILGIFGTSSGYNSIFNNTYKNVYFTSGGTLYAINNYWGGVPNSTMFYLGSNCFIDTRYYLSSDPWTNILTENFLKEEIINGVLGDLFLEGLLHFRNKKFNKAKDSFISYLNRFPEKQIAYNALFYCLNDETKSDIISFFKSLPAKANSSHKLLLSYIYIREGQINDAISNNEFIIQNNPNTPLSIEAKTNNLYIELYQNQDFEKACMIYNEIKSQPELSTPLELDMIQSSLESYAMQNGLIFSEFELKKAVNNFNLKPVEYSLSSNYPNPFNPSTIINYAVKDAGLVSIKVYDILGAEVATIVNETKEAGEYAIEFNASTLPSGVYIYSMKVNGFSSSKKMLLMK